MRKRSIIESRQPSKRHRKLMIKFTTDMEEAVIRLRLEGKGLVLIAERVGVCRDTLIRWCWEHGVSTRNPKTQDFRDWRTKTKTKTATETATV